VEIFGGLRAKGDWKLSKRQLSVNSEVKVNKFWINQFNLGDVLARVNYENGVTTFYPEPKAR